MDTYRYITADNSIVEVTESNGKVYNISAIYLDPLITPTPFKVTEVKRAQALHALAVTPSGASTLHSDVLDWVATQPLLVQIDFNTRDTFTINHPAIQEFKEIKGWSDAQLQDLFTLAATF